MSINITTIQVIIISSILLLGLGISVIFFIQRKKAPGTLEFYVREIAKAEKARQSRDYEKARKVYKYLIQGYQQQ